MDFVLGPGGGGGAGGVSVQPAATSLGGPDQGPILFSETNRTSAIDDLRSVVIYVFIITIFISFFLILPGIRSDKFPTFLCVTTSLLVTSIILIALFGTTWHQGQATIQAPYKAHSIDRIHGLLAVKVGLRSVNITLRAQKYYQMEAAHHQPVIVRLQVATTTNRPLQKTTTTTISPTNNKTTTSVAANNRTTNSGSRLSTEASSLAEELLGDRTADGAAVDTELEVEEVFPSTGASAAASPPSSAAARQPRQAEENTRGDLDTEEAFARGAFTVERSDVDINYNERFYWIEPNQMRQEHHGALERGLPYPILTVVEYLSQDEAGFSWSRQYRSAGYYSHILLSLALCLCVLMFFLHCAAPKYGIYTMQSLGALLLFTNFTYSILVPRGDQRLVIPFEGQTLTLKFGWSYWLVFIGGCLSLLVGTLIVIIDSLFPNYIFTTILDVDFDSHHKYYKKKKQQEQLQGGATQAPQRPDKPPFFDDTSASSASSRQSRSSGAPSTLSTAAPASLDGPQIRARPAAAAASASSSKVSHLSDLFEGPLTSRRNNSPPSFSSPTSGDSEMMQQQQQQRKPQQVKREASVVEMMPAPSDHYGRPTSNETLARKSNLDQQQQQQQQSEEANDDVRL